MHHHLGNPVHEGHPDEQFVPVPAMRCMGCLPPADSGMLQIRVLALLLCTCTFACCQPRSLVLPVLPAGVFGAYLLGIYDPDTETYQTISKLGTGFSEEQLQQLADSMRPHIIPQPRNYYRWVLPLWRGKDSGLGTGTCCVHGWHLAAWRPRVADCMPPLLQLPVALCRSRTGTYTVAPSRVCVARRL